MWSTLLPAVPLLVRAGMGAQGGGDIAGPFFLSLVPLVVAAPSNVVHLSEPRAPFEHLWRHILYTLGFASGAVLVRWVYVWQQMPSAWAVNLLVFFVAATATLALFSVVHFLEIRGARIRTHFGDVTVLPTTLVAIAVVLRDAPDACFLFSRSAVVTVPVVVAWATLFLIAHLEFALGMDTRLRAKGLTAFYHVTTQAAVVATTHLVLIETRANGVLYILFPACAAVFAQMAPDATRSPVVLPCSVPRLLIAAPAGGAAGAALRAVYANGAAGTLVAAMAAASALSQEVGLATLGDRWPVPVALLVALMVAAVRDALVPATPWEHHIYAGLVVVCAFTAVGGATARLSLTVAHFVAPPGVAGSPCQDSDATQARPEGGQPASPSSRGLWERILGRRCDTLRHRVLPLCCTVQYYDVGHIGLFTVPVRAVRATSSSVDSRVRRT